MVTTYFLILFLPLACHFRESSCLCVLELHQKVGVAFEVKTFCAIFALIIPNALSSMEWPVLYQTICVSLCGWNKNQNKIEKILETFCCTTHGKGISYIIVFFLRLYNRCSVMLSTAIFMWRSKCRMMLVLRGASPLFSLIIGSCYGWLLGNHISAQRRSPAGVD